jgi:poly(3-hydroxybutyrate) depolymerase
MEIYGRIFTSIRQITWSFLNLIMRKNIYTAFVHWLEKSKPALVFSLFLLASILPSWATTYPAVNGTNFPSGSYSAPGDAYPMPYRYFVPVGYNPAATGTKYPLVLFLHGAGERGTNNTSQLNSNANGAMIFISSASPNNQSTNPCFWVAPQLNGNLANFDAAWIQAQLDGIIKYFIYNYNIDVDRIYITGLSMGCGGTWNMLMNYPNRFAAAAPISGWGTSAEGPHKYVPVWAFSSADDSTQPPSLAVNAVTHMREAGGNPIYTAYGNSGGHNAWVSAYNSATPLVSWMMAQRRGQPNNLSSVFRVNSSSPTSGLTWVSNSTSLIVTGTTEDPGSAVTGLGWTNYKPWPYGTGTVSGTSTWTSSTITLSTGTSPGNLLNFLASTPTTFSAWGGTTTFSKAMEVYYSATADSTAPVVTITSPTSSTTYSTAASDIALAGTATDNLGVTKVKWTNNRGGTGTAKGTYSGGTYNWTIPGIDLWSGANILTVTAYDAAGNTSTDVITVTSGAATNTAPVVNAGSDQTVLLSAGASLSGSVTDDGVSPGNPTPTAAWTKFSGPGTVAFGNASAAVTTATFSVAGTYVLRLTGSDGVLSTTDDVQITVNAPTSVLFDFGTTPTAGNWNNVTTATTGTKITNAVTSTGGSTTIGLDITAPFLGATVGGSTSGSGAYPANAMVDSFFQQSWAGNDVIAKVKLTGLNPSKTYSLTFFASKLASGSRAAQYKVGTSTTTLEALDNVTNVATLPGLVPAADGTMEVEVKNTVTSGYFHLGVIEVKY